jgi:hypothetical protein
MASLDRIANVSISLATTAVSEQSFSDVLVVGPFAGTLSRYAIITSLADLEDYGIAETDDLYLAAKAVFSQSPCVSQLYIGRKLVDSVSVTVTSASVSTYALTIGYFDEDGVEQSQTFSYTGETGDTTAEIATALAALVTGIEVTAAASGSVITLTPSTAGDSFSVAVDGNLTKALGTSSESYSLALAAVLAETTGFYGVGIVSRESADVLSAAAWCEANNKLFGFATASATAYSSTSTTDLLSQVKALGYARTFGMYHALAATEWPELALMSNRFTFYPGAENWANVKLSAVTVDSLTETQSAIIKGKAGNTYEQFRNIAITQYGQVAAGEWIDVIRFRDWLVDQLKVGLVTLIVKAGQGAGKLPYIAAGLRMVKASIKSVLDLGVSRGGIAPEETDSDDNIVPSYTITIPDITEISAANKSQRILEDVKFTARLAGAINAITLTGSLSYDEE